MATLQPAGEPLELISIDYQDLLQPDVDLTDKIQKVRYRARRERVPAVRLRAHDNSAPTKLNSTDRIARLLPSLPYILYSASHYYLPPSR
jgi:hypothetical protein